MANVYLSLGSNIDAPYHISACVNALRNNFSVLDISQVYESEAVGFDGDNFLNLVVLINTELSVGELSKQLKTLEDRYGRDRNAARFSGRTLDVDILTYDDVVGEIDGVLLPRDEILTNAFVLKPLAEIAPNDRHPQRQQSYQSLWAAYDQTAQKLWPSLDLQF